VRLWIKLRKLKDIAIDNFKNHYIIRIYTDNNILLVPIKRFKKRGNRHILQLYRFKCF
jgi:hypothetical protein